MTGHFVKQQHVDFMLTMLYNVTPSEDVIASCVWVEKTSILYTTRRRFWDRRDNNHPIPAGEFEIPRKTYG